MSNFEWQQEDGDWDEKQGSSSPESSNLRRTILIGVVVVLALAAAGLIIYWQVNERLAQTETAVQANILASHNLVQTAAITEDEELLLSVLSGRLPSWTDAQQEALSADVMINRVPWRLLHIDALPDIDPQLTMSPDLTEAELVFPLDYHFMTTSGVSVTVVLSQTAVYRQGVRNWLMSPPDSEFWGDWQTIEGERLTLIHPERDNELVRKLAVDLEQILEQICTEPTLPDCAEDAAYTIRLDTHPESLVEGVDKRNLFGEQPYLNLPTPTLFGLPRDDVAYGALVQVYGVSLGTVVLADLFEWECCRQHAIFQVLVEYQLAEMDIMSWPITTTDHIRALKEGRSFLNVADFWRYEPADFNEPLWFLYTAFDFMFQQYPDLAPVSLLSSFRDWGDIGYWLDNNLTQNGYQLGSIRELWPTLQNEWWHYAYTQTLLAQENEEPPILLSAQDIVLVCLPDPQFDLDTIMSLHRFNHEEDTWQELLTYNNFVSFNPFLNDEGLIIQTLDLDETNRWQTEIWDFEGTRTQLANEDQMFFSLGQYDPSGRYAVSFTGEGESTIPKLLLIDLDSCNEETCETIQLTGSPIWSPDGNKTLMSSNNVFEGNGIALQRNGNMILFDATQPPSMADFWLGDRLGQLPVEQTELEEIGTGYSPFWLDNDTFGYIRQHPETGEGEVVVLGANGLETIITLTDIQTEALEGDLSLAHIRYVVTNPRQPDKLFVVALDALGREAYVFLHDMVTGTLELRLQSKVAPYHSLGFSPNGRWLVLTGYQDEEAGGSNTFIVHDIENNETQTYKSNLDGFMLSPLYDWSADGEWLLFLMNDQVLSMVAPEYNYQMVQVHEHGYCTSMAWVNR